MNFADKLIQLRKKAGWSQEELAEKMNVTRQSVSKWEGEQSVPDIEKIIYLSELFGVSTDYLLKDETKDTEGNTQTDDSSTLRRVSVKEASDFLSVKAATSKVIAFATFLCILSPICLMVLGVISEIPKYSLAENTAGGIGMIVLIILVTIAVALFISSGRKTAAYNFLEEEVFETESGVSTMVLSKKEEYNQTYTRNNIIGAVSCIMAIIPLFVGIILNEENELLLITMLSASLVIVGIGVAFFITSGIIWASYEKLLQVGDYSKDKKKNHAITSTITVAYWLIATAVYLGYSFSTENWEYSWVIWVVAGVLFPVVEMITNLFYKRK